MEAPQDRPGPLVSRRCQRAGVRAAVKGRGDDGERLGVGDNELRGRGAECWCPVPVGVDFTVVLVAVGVLLHDVFLAAACGDARDGGAEGLCDLVRADEAGSGFKRGLEGGHDGRTWSHGRG